MTRQSLGPLFGVGCLPRLQKIELGHFGIDNNHAIPRQLDDQIWFALARVGLLEKITVRAQPGSFYDAAEGLLSPPTPGLARPKDAAQLQRLLRQGLAMDVQGLQMLA